MCGFLLGGRLGRFGRLRGRHERLNIAGHVWFSVSLSCKLRFFIDEPRRLISIRLESLTTTVDAAWGWRCLDQRIRFFPHLVLSALGGRGRLNSVLGFQDAGENNGDVGGCGGGGGGILRDVGRSCAGRCAGGRLRRAWCGVRGAIR